jgi:hypothetical protein
MLYEHRQVTDPRDSRVNSIHEADGRVNTPPVEPSRTGPGTTGLLQRVSRPSFLINRGVWSGHPLDEPLSLSLSLCAVFFFLGYK